MKHEAEWWAKRIEELDATGDARAVAEKHGVREKTLKWWRSELRRRARSRATKAQLLPVVVKPRSTARPQTPTVSRVVAPLEVFVEIGAARITLRGAVSAEHVAAIVSSC